MSSDSTVISVQGLCKRYDVYAQPIDRLRRMIFGRLRRWVGMRPGVYSREFWALHPVSFEIRAGETVGIIGRNGSGKSTLLQLVCGTLTPTGGSVAARGRVAALLELGAGFNAEFSGEENIRLSGLLYGLSEKELADRFDSIIAFSELGEFITQPVKTYSSGMYVRLAFAIAAHVDADVLIIDEALSVGDVRFAQKCARFLREFQNRGTLLFVSHDLSAVINLCSRAIWLDLGRVVADGRSKEVVEAYLAEQHAQDRRAAGRSVSTSAVSPPRPKARDEQSALRPETAAVRRPAAEIRVFEFDPTTPTGSFGEQRVAITSVILRRHDGEESSFLCGEEVSLTVEAEAREDVDNLIFGFFVKDRLGQRLFGDNSYLKYLTAPLRAVATQTMSATFRFRMPDMPAGEYTIDVAVATGSQLEHTQQHWIHDALTFRSSDTTQRHGLVGIPIDTTVHIATAPAQDEPLTRSGFTRRHE